MAPGHTFSSKRSSNCAACEQLRAETWVFLDVRGGRGGRRLVGLEELLANHQDGEACGVVYSGGAELLTLTGDITGGGGRNTSGISSIPLAPSGEEAVAEASEVEANPDANPKPSMAGQRLMAAPPP